jgi:hypothetical protein
MRERDMNIICDCPSLSDPLRMGSWHHLTERLSMNTQHCRSNNYDLYSQLQLDKTLGVKVAECSPCVANEGWLLDLVNFDNYEHY